jgi:predicted glycoside hydrolase/deacetylase ChbG (UPF0249 family)
LRPGEILTFVKQKASALALVRYAADFQARLRTANVSAPDAFFGFAHTGLLNPALICCIIRLLPIGISELMCHPSELDDTLRHYPTRLKTERLRELAALTDPQVQAEILHQNIQLVSFADLDHREAACPYARRA